MYCNPRNLRRAVPDGQEALLPVEESNKAVREQISRQEFSAEDVERHLEERRRIRDAMLAATEAKEKARKVRDVRCSALICCGLSPFASVPSCRGSCWRSPCYGVGGRLRKLLRFMGAQDESDVKDTTCILASIILRARLVTHRYLGREVL